MPIEHNIKNIDEVLERKLHRQIEQRTWGHVRYLRVALGSDGVVVHGLSPSYYIKQLVLATVREVLPSTPVDLDIEVLDYFARSPGG